MMRCDLDLPESGETHAPRRMPAAGAGARADAGADASAAARRGAIIAGSVCAVTLVERGTGRPLRVNGSRVTLYTRSPEAAVQDLMAGRDPTVWDARIVPLDPARWRT